MSVREIKTTIAVDGEKKFKAALDDAGRSLRVMGADMKAAAAEFDATGNKQQYVTERSRLLRDEIAQQEKIVDSLVNAVRDSSAKYGDAGKQTDGYRIKLSTATATLIRMKKELSETDREAEELGRDSVRVGRQIESGIGDAAEEASKSLDDMIGKIGDDLSSIRGSATFSVVSKVTQFVSKSISGITDFVDNNAEYRRTISFFEQNALDAHVNLDEANKMLFSVASLTGDLDGASEGMSNLMKSGFSGEWLQRAIDLLGGASIVWQDTLKFENLAESMQESIATGKGTGAFGELIERLGGNLDDFNKAMEGQTTLEGKQETALAWISGKGLLEAKHDYEERNASLLEQQKANLELTQAWADLAAEFDPLVTGIIQTLTDIVKAGTDGVKGIKRMLAGDDEFIYGDKTKEEATAQTVQATTEAQANPQAPSNFLQDFFFKIQEWTTGGTYKNGVYVGEDGAKEAGREDAAQYAEGAKEALTESMPTLAELMDAYNTGGTEGVKNALSGLTLTEDQIASVKEMFSALGIDSAAIFDTKMQEGMGAAINNARISGENSATALGNGIAAYASYPISEAWKMADEINAAYASIGSGTNAKPTYPGSGGGTSGSGGTPKGSAGTPIVMQVNGREIARAVVGDISSFQGKGAVRVKKG